MKIFNHYPYRPERRAVTLPAFWDFAWCGTVPLEDFKPCEADYLQKLPVPGCFDVHPAFAGAAGTGCYRTQFEAPEGDECLRLTIEALGLRGRVFLDGAEIGGTVIPFTPLRIDFPAEKGLHTLEIAVNNVYDFDRTRTFLPHMDFFRHGGIYRDVSLSVLPRKRIERIEVRTLDHFSRRFELHFRFGGEIAGKVRVRLGFDGEKEIGHELDASSPRLVFERPDFGLWSPEHPELHTLHAEFEGDRIVERFGLRTVETKGDKILFNGAEIRIRGLNRHDAHPDFGYSVPPEIHAQDVWFLKDLSCNFVRGAHYPQSQSFLDLCDEVGLLVWEETIGSGGESVLCDSLFLADVEQEAGTMVRESFNHPSVIIFGFFNEGASEKAEAAEAYDRIAAFLRKFDSGRLITAALRELPEHCATRECDIVAFNGYPAWGRVFAPEPRPMGTIRETFEKFAQTAEKDPAMHGKPLLVSETGAAAIYGSRDRYRGRWSEEYQADVIRESITSVMEDPRFAGIAIWQFCDTRSCMQGELCMNRPRGFNNKGVMDEYRRPKASYGVMKELFHRFEAPISGKDSIAGFQNMTNESEGKK